MLRAARLAQLAIVAVLTAALAGCDSGGQPADPTGGPSDPSVAPSPAALAVDWEHPENAQLPDSWSLSFCDGAAGLVCVARDGQPAGHLEALGFEVATLPDFATALESAGEAAALQDHARRFVEDFTADRAEGCGAGYSVTAAPTQQFATADGVVLRYGFAGAMADGRPSEHVLHYGGVREERLILLVATASDPDGCLASGGEYFTSESLAAFVPVLDRIVIGAGLPTPRS
jgi:hypothetical protein